MVKKQNIGLLLAEFLGVIVLTLVVISLFVTQISIPLFVALAAGFTLSMIIMVLSPVAGVHINPAITLGLWSIRKVKTINAIVYIVVQALAAVVALLIVQKFIGETGQNASGKIDSKVIIAEAIGAFVFGLGVASAVYRKYEGAKFAFTIGGSLALGVMVASLGSKGVLNPALAYGLRTLNWNYILGPIIGSILGMNVFALLYADSVQYKFPKLPIALKSKQGKSARKASVVTVSSKKKTKTASKSSKSSKKRK